MQLFDRLTLDGPRRDSAGNLIASVLAAKVGVQDYAGYEVGKPELARVSIYRPESEVFSRDSMRSFAGAPVTIEHPSESVTPENWKDHAVGETSEEVVRDGEAVRVPFLLRDAGGIKAVENGKREVSMGYGCELVWGDGVAPDGTPYQATQTAIRINHLAIVDRARGGPTLRIGDSDMTLKKILVDGLQVETTDAGEAAIVKLQGLVADSATKLAAADTKVAELTTQLSTKDAEIATLKQAVTDAAVTPAKLQAMATARAAVITDAKAIVPALVVTDAQTDMDIKRAVVNAKLGDVAKEWTDQMVDASFATMPRTASSSAVDPLRQAIGDSFNVVDAAKAAAEARQKRLDRLANGHRAAAAA